MLVTYVSSLCAKHRTGLQEAPEKVGQRLLSTLLLSLQKLLEFFWPLWTTLFVFFRPELHIPIARSQWNSGKPRVPIWLPQLCQLHMDHHCGGPAQDPACIPVLCPGRGLWCPISVWWPTTTREPANKVPPSLPSPKHTPRPSFPKRGPHSPPTFVSMRLPCKFSAFFMFLVLFPCFQISNREDWLLGHLGKQTEKCKSLYWSWFYMQRYMHVLASILHTTIFISPVAYKHIFGWQLLAIGVYFASYVWDLVFFVGICVADLEDLLKEEKIGWKGNGFFELRTYLSGCGIYTWGSSQGSKVFTSAGRAEFLGEGKGFSVWSLLCSVRSIGLVLPARLLALQEAKGLLAY